MLQNESRHSATSSTPDSTSGRIWASRFSYPAPCESVVCMLEAPGELEVLFRDEGPVLEGLQEEEHPEPAHGAGQDQVDRAHVHVVLEGRADVPEEVEEAHRD